MASLPSRLIPAASFPLCPRSPSVVTTGALRTASLIPGQHCTYTSLPLQLATLPWVSETRGCRPGRAASSLSLPACCLGLCLGCASDLGLGTWGGPPKSFSPLHLLSEAFLLPLPCRRAPEGPAPPYFRAWSLSVPRTPHPSSVSPASLFIPERRDLGCSVYSAWCPNPSEWSGRESPPPDTFPSPSQHLVSLLGSLSLYTPCHFCYSCLK